MASVFSPCDVGVIRVSTACPSNSPFAAITVDSLGVSFQVPITGYTLDLGTNHQFLHTLDEFIYIYAFGDRVGELVLSGVAFTETCVRDESNTDLAEALSPKSVLKHYVDNRISKKSGLTSTLITINNADVFIGFLTGMRLDLPNPALPIVQWALRYNVILNQSPITINSPAPVTPGGPRAGNRSLPSPATPRPPLLDPNRDLRRAAEEEIRRRQRATQPYAAPGPAPRSPTAEGRW